MVEIMMKKKIVLFIRKFGEASKIEELTGKTTPLDNKKTQLFSHRNICRHNSSVWILCKYE